MRRPEPKYGGMLLSLLASLLFGCGSTVLKLIYRYFGQIYFGDLAWMRSVFCAVFFFGLTIKKDVRLLKCSGKDLLFFCFMGVCGLFLVQYGLLLALQWIPVGVTTFAQSSSTLLVCIFSALLFHETITGYKVLGLILGLGGFALVVWTGEGIRAGNLFWYGILAAIGSAVGKTVYILCGKTRHNRMTLIPYGMLFGAVMGVFFISSPRNIAGYFSDANAIGVIFVYLLVFSALPYLCTFCALRRIPASSAGVLNVLEPVAAALSAFLILGETLSGRQLAGCGVVLASVFLIQKDLGGKAVERGDSRTL